MSPYLQKSTSALMIFIALANTVLIILIYQPQKAEAFNPFVFDIPHTIGTIGGWIKSAAHWIWEGIKFAADKAWQGAKWLWEKRQTLKGWLWETTKESTKKALSVFRKQTLNYMVNHLANYIQYGGREGGPSFIPDWKTFLYGTGGARDQALGEFANTFWQNITAELTPEVQAAMESAGISTTNLCEIDPGSWTGLIGIGAGAPVKTFTSKDVACTAREAKANLKEAKEKLVKFYEDFGEDGWDTWLEVTQTPQNNPYGFYLTVLDKKMGIEAETTESEKAKAIAGAGWLGKEQCSKYVNNVHMAKPTAQNITYNLATGAFLGFDWLTNLNHELVEKDPERKKIVPIVFSADNLKLGIIAIENTLRDYYVFPESFPEVAREPFITTDAELISNALKDISSLKSNGFTCADFKVLTPGQLIGQAVAKQYGGKIDWLMSTEEMEQYTTALATAGINRLFSEGRGLLGKWLGDEEADASAADDQYQKFLASLPDASEKQKADQATREQFSKAQGDYQKFSQYQSDLSDDKKQEEVSRIAETPAQELLFTLEDLESALNKKLKPSLETLKSLQDQNLKIWQKKALGALLGYYFIKNVYYKETFGNPESKPGEKTLWFDEEGVESKCLNEELEREYVIEYDRKANYSGYTDNAACSGTNPLICRGKEKDSGMEGLFVRNEKINLIAKRLGKIIGAPVEYPTLKTSLIPSPMQCGDIPDLNCITTPSDPGCDACIGYSHDKSNQYVPVYSNITDEEQIKITNQISATTNWLAKIKIAKDALTTEIHAGLNYLQLHKGYTGIYKWATSINSQDKVVLTELELQGLERLESIWSNLANWGDLTIKDSAINALEKKLEDNQYAKTQEFISAVQCYTSRTCAEQKDKDKARDTIVSMVQKAKTIYDNALAYAQSPESPSGKEIDFYYETIGLNRFKNAIEDNEQKILSGLVPALASDLPEFNEYLGVKTINIENIFTRDDLCERYSDCKKECLDSPCVISFWKYILDEIEQGHEPKDNEGNSIQQWLAEYNLQEALRLFDKKADKTLDQVIDDAQKAASAVKEKVADIEAGFREMTFETSTPDITPSSVYHKQLQSIIKIYNNAYQTWASCNKAL